jgi:hypothetical protein
LHRVLPFGAIPLGAALIALCAPRTAGAASALVKDINEVVAYSPLSPLVLADMNGTLYALAEDPAHGRELWKSDGTPAGTVW